MRSGVNEKDWKALRAIRAELLSALCFKINSECSAIITSQEGTDHDRYLRLYKYIHEADKLIVDCFDNLKRSNMEMKLLHINKNNLLKAEHINCFSQEIQELLNRF